MGTKRGRTEDYAAHELGEVLSIALQMYEAEKRRGDALERKGAQLIGFGGIVISLSALTIGNLHHFNIPAQLLLAAALLGMMWAVYCGIRTVRTRMYQVPSMSSITGNVDVEGLTREYIDDVFSAHQSHESNRRISGGWLQNGEKWLGRSLLLLALAIVAAVAGPVLIWLCNWAP